MTTYDIRHDPERQRFSLILDGVEAYLTYETPREGHRHITHTIVPEKLGGRGLGKRLVEAVMQDTLAAGLIVSSSCWFASALIKQTPDWTRALSVQP